MAAAQLLIDHVFWLCRDDFVDRCVAVDEDAAVSGTALAWIDWRGAVSALDEGGLPCSDGEEQVLRLAASIGDGARVDLGSAVSSLDVANLELVTAAIRHAGGYHDVPAMQRGLRNGGHR